MVLVRDIFQLKFGKSRDALALLKEGLELMKNTAQVTERVLTDITGQYYTLVMETTYASLSEFEKMLKNDTGSDEWRKWYQRFVPLVETGRREIFSIVNP